MKKSYLIVFLFLTVLLTGCAFAANTTGMKVTTSKDTVKMGDTIDFTATKYSNDQSKVVFKVNQKTVTDKKNNPVKVKPVNKTAKTTYTVPDGMRAGRVEVSAVSTINGSKVVSNTSFNVEKMNTRFTNITVYRSLDTFKVNSVILDDNNHTMYGSAKVAIKINGKTYTKNNETLYFKATNGVLNANIKLDKSYMNRDVTLMLVTGDTYSYIGTRHVIENLKDGSIEVKRLNIHFVNTTIDRKKNSITISSLLVDDNNLTVKDTSKIAIKLNNKTLQENNKARYFYAVNGALNATFKIGSGLSNNNISIMLVTGDTYSYIGKRVTYYSFIANNSYKFININDLDTISSNTSDSSKDSTNINNTTSHKTRKTKMASVFVKLYTNVSSSDVQKWVDSGITDVMVQTSISLNDTNKLREVINLCKNTNIKVQAWVLCFKVDGKWVNTPAQEKLIKTFISKVIRINGVDGICLDYVRYSGTNPSVTNSTRITKFVKEVNSLIKSYDKELELSACVFAEKAGTKTYYGQDYVALCKELDFIMPMAYKYSYNEDRDWLKDVTKYICDRTTKAKVVTILMTYKDEEITELISVSELTADIKAVMSVGSYGYSLFYKTAIKEYPKIF